MTRHIHLLVPSWTMRSLRSWTRWWRTQSLAHQVRRLRKKVLRQERALLLQREFLTLLEQLEHPQVLVLQPDPSGSPTPISDLMPPEWVPPPPLTPEEIKQLRAMPMPDPLEEIEQRLGLSTTPLSPQTWEG